MRNRSLGESFRCAFAGLGYAVRTQRNLRLHLVAALLVLGLSAWLALPAAAVALLLTVVALVVVAEVVNTALETVIDLVSPGYHPLAGLAKNLAAAAVVLAALFAAVIGFLVLGPPLWTRLLGGH
ncbi:MAG TPA: diacylglycerol kinase family protein [Firmicutes bacterium]|nr:diacylglycerol kinase family protein [Bacillota bacterium]